MTSVARKREETRRLLRSVLLPNKKGLLLTDLEKEYRGMTGTYIPYRALGYSSFLSLLMDMSDVATMEKLPSGHQLVMATPDHSTQHIADMVSCQKDNMEGYNQNTGRVLAGQSRLAKSIHDFPQHQTIPADRTVSALMKERLGMLLSQVPCGLLYSQLSASYRQLHGEELDPLSIGQTSGLELCCQLPDVVQIQQVEGGRDWLLLPVRSQQSQSADLTDRSSISQLSDRLEVQQLPHNVCVGVYVEVAVTAVRSPSKLYIQLRNMQDMLGELTEAIGNEIKVGVEGELRPMEVRVGMVVAALINGHWYRVMVLRMKEMSKVKIFLNDYGIILTVQVSSLRYLSVQLSQVPAQALPTSLAKWPNDTGAKLKQVLIDKQEEGGVMMAKVERLQDQQSRMAVWLVDSKGVIINMVLGNESNTLADTGTRQQELLNRLTNVSKLVREKLNKSISNNAILDRLECLVSGLEAELIPESVSRVFRTEVGEYIMHIMQWQGRYWCASKEIASLVQDWRGWDLLDKMILSKNMNLEKVVLNRDKNAELWEEMDSLKVFTDVTDESSFYLLGDVPSIVRTFARLETRGGVVERVEEIVKSCNSMLLETEQ